MSSPAVEHEHRNRSGHVEPVIVAPDLGEILLQKVGVDAARLVVAAVVENRCLGGKGPDRGVDEIAVELFGTFGAVRHVAVEGYEVDPCKVDRAAESGHVFGTSVDVVQHDERKVAARRGEGSECKRLARVDVRGCDVAVVDPVVVFPLAHLLREDAVAVFRVGTEPFQADAVERLVGLLAPGYGLVAAFVFHGVETASVVLGHLDPRKGGFAGGPDYRDSVRGQVAEPGTVRDLEILRHEGRTRGQRQDRR